MLPLRRHQLAAICRPLPPVRPAACPPLPAQAPSWGCCTPTKGTQLYSCTAAQLYQRAATHLDLLYILVDHGIVHGPGSLVAVRCRRVLIPHCIALIILPPKVGGAVLANAAQHAEICKGHGSTARLVDLLSGLPARGRAGCSRPAGQQASRQGMAAAAEAWAGPAGSAVTHSNAACCPSAAGASKLAVTSNPGPHCKHYCSSAAACTAHPLPSPPAAAQPASCAPCPPCRPAT